jgi:hypothetical protein
VFPSIRLMTIIQYAGNGAAHDLMAPPFQVKVRVGGTVRRFGAG